MVIGASIYLRPAADDYCFGSVTAQYGVIGGVIYWWNHWSGFVFSMMLGNLFVGLPLAVLPLPFVSSIPFLCVAFGMGFLVLHITGIKLKLITQVFFICFIAFCWWQFLWLPMSIDSIPYFGRPETNGLTFWQTLNGTYVLQLQILLVLFAYATRCISAHRSQITYSTLAAFTGALAGFSGTALSVSVVAFSALVLIGLQLTNLHNRESWKHYWLVLGISTTIGLWICHAYSPGNHLREQAIGVDFDISIAEMVGILFTSLLQGFRKWVKFYFNLGGISLFVLICGFSYQMAKLNLFFGKSKELWFGLAFAFFALLQCCVSRLADQLTYIAYWHYISALVCVFLSIYFLASYSGCWLHTRIQNRRVNSSSMALLIGLIILGAYGNSLMAGEMRLREKVWAHGPANLEGVSDIEDPAGWQMDCWKKLDAYRDIKTIRK
jgi:hypothetical protein